MSADDLNMLRDEVAEVEFTHGGFVPAPRVGDGWRCWCGADLRDWWPEGGVTPRDTALDYALRAHRADALLPLLAQRIGAARAEAEAKHRDLTSRLGFGDNITEPQADNDTIVAWFEERGREASEWVESQLWRNDCYAKGHPDDDDCFECDPAFAYERGLAEGEARVRARVEGDDVLGDVALRVARAVEGQAAALPESGSPIRVERCYSHGIARAALSAIRAALAEAGGDRG